MAFCTQCGETLPDDVKYCTRCGARQPEAAAPGQERNAPQPVYGVSYDPEIKKKSGRKPKLGIILAFLLLGVAVGVIAAAVSAGSGTSLAEDMTTLVQGNIDAIYLGQFSESYIDLVQSSADRLQKEYESGLDVETDFFMDYFVIDYPTEEMRQAVRELYREIYSHSSYTVNPATEMDDGSYAVRVQIRPIDVMQLVSDNFDAGMAEVDEKYADADFENMSDAEYMAYDADWAWAVIQIVREQLPYLGHMAEETVIVHVDKGEDGVWQIVDSDAVKIDELIIYYP